MFKSRQEITEAIKNKNMLKRDISRFKEAKGEDYTWSMRGVDDVYNKAGILLAEVKESGHYKSSYSAGFNVDVTVSAIWLGYTDIEGKSIYICTTTGNPFVVRTYAGNAYVHASITFAPPKMIEQAHIDEYNMRKKSQREYRNKVTKEVAEYFKAPHSEVTKLKTTVKMLQDAMLLHQDNHDEICQANIDRFYNGDFTWWRFNNIFKFNESIGNLPYTLEVVELAVKLQSMSRYITASF